METNAIAKQLEAARAELEQITSQIADLERRRDIAAAKVEAFELSARYIEGMRLSQNGKKTASPRTGRTRTPSSDWLQIFQSVHALYDHDFGYDEIMEVGAMLENIDVKRPSLRTKMMNYVNEGYVERTGNGRFRITDTGAEYFKLNTQMNEAPDETRASSNIGDVAERSNASDSKSDEPYPAKDVQGSVGSNPTVSAPNPTRQDELLGSASFGVQPQNRHWRRKEG